MHTLSSYGWTDHIADSWQQVAATRLVPARVVADFGTSLKLATPSIITAELSGKLAHYTTSEHMPKVGDWVGAHITDSGAVVEVVVPRRNDIARKVAGKRVAKQIMAANVDIAFVLLALDGDFSIQRLQRFLYQLSISRIDPVIVLNKADQADDVAAYVESLRSLDLPIIISSAIDGTGVAEVTYYITPGTTAILLGSSGVGKSTLTNQLLGRDEQSTKAVRASDSTGQHTTVHRELFVLPGGGLLIDAPGIRELQLWGTDEDLADAFDDITGLMTSCKYTSCRHEKEEGCAIQAALHCGKIDATHYDNYLKMRTELKSLHQKNDIRQRRGNRRSPKNLRRQSQDMNLDTSTGL